MKDWTAEAERLARPHKGGMCEGFYGMEIKPPQGRIEFEPKYIPCTCGRDGEVKAIAAALEAAYNEGCILTAAKFVEELEKQGY
jgi:hypothetical protein